MEDLIDPQWHCYTCRRVVRDDQENERRKRRPINEIWGTAFGRKPSKSPTRTTEPLPEDDDDDKEEERYCNKTEKASSHKPRIFPYFFYF
jgi:hypothetical protein